VWDVCTVCVEHFDPGGEVGTFAVVKDAEFGTFLGVVSSEERHMGGVESGIEAGFHVCDGPACDIVYYGAELGIASGVETSAFNINRRSVGSQADRCHYYNRFHMRRHRGRCSR
jgi:hypothetical protein